MTKENKDKKLKTLLSQSAVEGFVMPGVFAAMSTVQAESACEAYINSEPNPALYIFENVEAMREFTVTRLEPLKMKA